MAHEAEFRLLATAFAVEPGIGIGGRGVRVVAALLAVKVLLPVAARIRRRPKPSFGRKLLVLAHASSSVPSTEKCSPDSSTFTFGCASTAARNLVAISPASKR